MEKNSKIVSVVSTQSLIEDLRHIINQARGRVAATANYELTMMYWHIGERINREVLGNQRAEYGLQMLRKWCNNCNQNMVRKDLKKVPSQE